MTLKEFFDQLILGNPSVIQTENIRYLNERAMSLYNKQQLSLEEIEELKQIIMICNILYNRTDMTILPIEDGFYDVLLEKYKQYDENFQVGSAIIEFRNFIENDLDNPQKIAIQPIIFDEIPKRNEIRQEMYENIMRVGQPILNKNDFKISPISFDQTITKRTHNTEHNHPSLVGTLDKAKFIFVDEAIRAGVADDPNVKILERDFFIEHIKKGIYRPDRIINVVLELKYDGISVEADCGLELYSARTRGDTGIGAAADITPILQGYPFRQARCMIGEKPIGVKFEAIITKGNMQKFNELRDRNYKNCRTAIVGLFGSNDGHLYRDLITLIPLALDREDLPQISNRMEEIMFLNKVFSSHGEPLRYCIVSGTVQEVLYLIKAFWDEALIARDYLDFMYDGIVVSYLDEDIIEKLGRKNFINKYSMAVKFNPLEKQTIFRGYTYEVGQNGQITPMIHYDPVEFLGTIHTKSTGSSLQRFKELGLKYGDFINVTYVNDVMPYVTRCECDHNRKNINNVEEFIKNCPVCGSNLVESDSGKTAICPNVNCKGRSIQRMVNTFDKLNIKGFADATIIALGVDHISDLYYEVRLRNKEYFINILGNADGTNMYNALYNLLYNRSNPIPDYIYMGSLGFTGIAHKKWKSILEQITVKDLHDAYLRCMKIPGEPNLDEFRSYIISKVHNIGPITLDVIVNEFGYFFNDINWMDNIVDSFGNIREYKLQIRFTGIRNKQLSELLCNAGYDADDSSSVTRKTNILIVPYEGFSSTKVQKAPEGCLVVPIDEFKNNMEKYIGEKLI